MKNTILILSVFILTCISSCDKNSDDELNQYPRCIQTIIDNILELSVQTPRANIEKYIYNGDEVFVINDQNFPDGESAVVSSNCVLICALGGINGEPSPECSDFNDNSTLIEVVWTDPR